MRWNLQEGYADCCCRCSTIAAQAGEADPGAFFQTCRPGANCRQPTRRASGLQQPIAAPRLLPASPSGLLTRKQTLRARHFRSWGPVHTQSQTVSCREHRKAIAVGLEECSYDQLCWARDLVRKDFLRDISAKQKKTKQNKQKKKKG